MSKESGIYQISAKGIFYVGSAKNINKRWGVHVRALRSGNHHSEYMQNIYNKYGIEVFSFEVLEIVTDNIILLEREQYHLDRLFSTNSNDSIFNTLRVAGNSLGRKLTVTQKERLRQVNLGKHHTKEACDKIRNARLGTKHTESQLLKLRASSLKRWGNRTYLLVSPDGVLHETWDLPVFCSDLNLPYTNISRLMRGERKRCKGWTKL